MKRRDFLAGSALAATATAAVSASAQEAGFGGGGQGGREYYELRTYKLTSRSAGGRRLNAFLRDAAIPAWNRMGIGPVGVFSGVFGGEWLDLQVLLPHPSIDSVANATAGLLDDEEFTEAAGDFLDTPITDPGYVRYESSLMVAFKGMPKLKAPEQKDRIFELRRYESHSVKAGQKKIHMFNEGEEIKIFLETGLAPVFFGETIMGAAQPNLTYMLTFDDLEDRAASWSTFGSSPQWQKLSSDPQYADTVSNISSIILRPADYSQV